MVAQKKNLVCGWLLPVVFLFAGPVWGQISPREYYALRSTSHTNDDGKGALRLQPFSEANGMGPDSSTVSEPSSTAVNEASPNDRSAAPSLAPCESTKQVIRVAAEPASSDTQPPATLTVRASALLELHEMRQSAVDLCLQLPAKYRTQLPQCADIFKHEIRLKALAQKRP
jgi:hypothetical protein